LIRWTADDEGLAFHDLAAGRVRPEPLPTELELTPPAYRGKRLLPVLSWLVTNRLAAAGTRVTWRVERRHGPDPARQALEPFGWRLEAERAGRWLLLSGPAPTPHPLPPPRSFQSAGLTFEADYGVFSPDRIDAGSALLLDVAARLDPVESVADIGVGYGALAISLVANGLAGGAVATEVDSIAAWLAERNAAAADVPLELALDGDPLSVARTPLTVCNVPTHLDAGRSAALMAALAERARDGRLLAVVHAELAERYAGHLDAPRLHAGDTHVVLEAGQETG
jgi:16S rRNA G1207 methylase RsmC